MTHQWTCCSTLTSQYNPVCRSLTCRVQPHSSRLSYTHWVHSDQMTPRYSRCSSVHTSQAMCSVYSTWPIQFGKSSQPHHSAKDLVGSNQLDKRPRRFSFIAKTKAKDFMRNLMQGPQRAFKIKQVYVAFCWLALKIFKWQRKEESETFICLFSGRTGVLSPKQTRKTRISISMVDVTLQKVYCGKLMFTTVTIKDDLSLIR